MIVRRSHGSAPWSRAGDNRASPVARAFTERIHRAIVRLPRLDGRGVLVSGGFIVTAAHCIGWTAKGQMVLGNESEFVEEIETADGARVLAYPLAVEPVSDLAVLGAPDDQWMPEAAEGFEAFCETTRAIPLALDAFVLLMAIPAYVFTHDKGILPMQTALHGTAVVISGDERIEGGTSGSPIVTAAGRLLGIVSHFADGHGGGPRVSHAAPFWLVRQMVPARARRALDTALSPNRGRRGRGEQ